MIVNGQMVVLAREIREITQAQLANKTYVSQATIARIEGDPEANVTDERIELISRALDFPREFFAMKEDLIGFGSSAYYYRKRASMSAADRKRIHGIVNVLRINIKRLLDAVEIVPKRKLPSLELDDYGGRPALVAQAVRAFWNLPEGPINNLTHLIESAGVIVVPCDFGTTTMDATSLRLAEIPPVIFISAAIPGDRWRFTLAHELAHLVMHQIPHEKMEDEADAFAAEFLMPAIDMRAFFSRLPKIRLQDLINVKPYWKVSIASLIERAYNLNFINDNSRRYLWAYLGRIGYPVEPLPIQKETAKNHGNMIEYFTNTLKYDAKELAKMFRISHRDLEFLYGPSSGELFSRPQYLRAVR